MDKATLVSIDIEGGRELLKLLDEAKFKVVAVVWLHLPEFFRLAALDRIARS
jgi:hypothetical protein